MGTYVYIDTETTGLDPVKNDIIQLAALVEVDGKIIREFNDHGRPFNPDSISQQALDTNQLTKEQIMGFQDTRPFFNKFISFLGDLARPDFIKKNGRIILVGQNVIFDKNMLERLFFKMGYSKRSFDSIFHYHHVDLLSMSFVLRNKGYIPLKSMSLGPMAEYFGIEFEKQHDALSDIKVTYQLFKKMDEIFLKNLNEISLDSFPAGSPIRNHFEKLLSTAQQSN